MSGLAHASFLASTVIALALSGSASRAQEVAAGGDRDATRPAATRTDDSSIRPFQVHVPEEALADLRRRLAATRWPDKETVADSSQGVQSATIRELVRYWQSEYDWRKIEARLNSLPQFVTTIDGLDIHFIHVRSRHPKALPVIVTHGWPGSIVEQLKIIAPLTDPTAHGGSAEDAFDVVIPSMPGYGFSGRPTTTGWDSVRTARAWIVLMKRLGYTRFVAQGGDWGAIITDAMAELAAPELIAIHSNMPGILPPEISKALHDGDPPPAGLSADEQRAYEQVDYFYKHCGYAVILNQRPQTLTGLADSPAGLAAFLLDHDRASYEHIVRLFAGEEFGAITRDDILDNITLCWLTNTEISSARLYWENKLGFFDAKNVAIPVAVSVFPEELYQAPRSWTERAYPNLVYFNELDVGGHFAAWEQPALFVGELRAAFRSVR